MAPRRDPVLEVNNLRVHFRSSASWFGPPKFVRAVDGVSFRVMPGETYAIVGESGCGKSTTARAVLNLVRPTGGEVYLDGTRIDGLSDEAMRPWRRTVQMVFQDPFSSLNPRMTVGGIIREPMRIFRLGSTAEQKEETIRLMEIVGLNPRVMNRYPHEFSGGQRQRIGIARALAVKPKLIVCDEPVSALDVSIQAQVVNLLQDLQEQLGLTYVFIAHDLAVVRHIAHRVGVMYLGRIVEEAPAAELYGNPRHPYTQALMEAVPHPDPVRERNRAHTPLGGEPPSPEEIFTGCRFADRCPLADLDCFRIDPPLEGTGHRTACIKVEL
jgi:oligopeptide transport system ATP-binding protein